MENINKYLFTFFSGYTLAVLIIAIRLSNKKLYREFILINNPFGYFLDLFFIDFIILILIGFFWYISSRKEIKKYG